MKENKGYIYTIILGVCLMGCLLLIGKMLLSSSTPLHSPPMPSDIAPSAEESYFRLSEDTLESMIRDNASGIPLDNVEVTIAEDNALQFDLTMKRRELKKTAQENSQLSAYSDIIDFLPEDVCFRCSVGVGSTNSGEVAVSLETVSVMEQEIPKNIVTDTIFSGLSQSINQMLRENHIQVSELVCKDGYLMIKK